MTHRHRWLLGPKCKGPSGLPAIRFVCALCGRKKVELLPEWAR